MNSYLQFVKVELEKMVKSNPEKFDDLSEFIPVTRSLIGQGGGDSGPDPLSIR